MHLWILQALLSPNFVCYYLLISNYTNVNVFKNWNLVLLRWIAIIYLCPQICITEVDNLVVSYLVSCQHILLLLCCIACLGHKIICAMSLICWYMNCGLMLKIHLWTWFLQDSPEVHVNAAETLCAITRFAPSGLSAKISSPR